MIAVELVVIGALYCSVLRGNGTERGALASSGTLSEQIEMFKVNRKSKTISAEVFCSKTSNYD